MKLAMFGAKESSLSTWAKPDVSNKVRLDTGFVQSAVLLRHHMRCPQRSRSS